MILLTYDYDSVLSQGQRAGENKDSAKNVAAFRLCYWRQPLQHRTTVHRVCWILNIHQCQVLLCIHSLFLQYTTHLVCNIPLTLYSKDSCVVKPEDQRRNSNYISKGIFLCANATTSAFRPAHCHLPSSSMNLFQNPPKHWTQRPRHCCHGGHLNITFPSS